MLKLFNTATRSKEEFVPINPGQVSMYSCGPTVYDVSHIGNLSAFLFVDLLRRWLEYRGYKVKFVMNITDVEDKIIRNCAKTLPGLKEYTEKYTKILFEDLKRIGIKPADHYPKATECVEEMVSLVQVLLGKGLAYTKDGSVYYRISAFPAYGKFAGLTIDSLKVGARVDSDEYDKDDAHDFVLWKGWKPEEDGEIYWDTAIGRGRPGWHIECSAMCMKYLGEMIDIHTGGVDLVFPHHQNEIAQSEGATGKQFSKYWLHRAFLNIGGDKMSKSAGTGSSLADIAPHDLDATAFRYLIISSHYRTPLNFTKESLASARNAVVNLRGIFTRLSKVDAQGENQVEALVKTARQEFDEAMDDDLGSPKAMAAVFKLLNKAKEMMQAGTLSKASAQAVQIFLREIDTVIGVNFSEQNNRMLKQDENNLIQEREAARKAKDWKRADEIRSQLEEKGIGLEDTAQGVVQFFI